ncbi:VPS10 domain-containing receptor SorCS3-like [Physella acuta]|uniref:VPS10 domain-containing receptor SorCS3-like n=1 Tax=Physella acuta TaxID=109671 RepID=UPI0027DE4BA4|nr:VPS10 domain-containing receptor SorCS3-like [Physella acuta]
MADNNKQTLSTTSRMLFLKTLILLVLVQAISCAIFKHNNKYSKKQKLYTIELENNFLKTQKKDFKPHSNSQSHHHLHTRDAGAVKPEILLNRTIFNGTENSTHAYVHWIGKGVSERIFVLTIRQNYSTSARRVEESKLWRSEDYGSTFKEVKLAEGAKISYIYIFPKNEKKLLFTDVMAKKIYVTEDELQTNKSYNVDVEPDEILTHPTDENKILLYSHTQLKLYASVDFGATWTLLSENVLPNFFWGEEGYDSDPNTVHMEVKGAMPNQAFYKSCLVPDCKQTANQQLGDVGPFMIWSLVVNKEYMLVQKSNLNGSQSYLAVSYKRKPFQRAYFPKDLKSSDFVVLSMDDGQLFVAVKHDDSVNLYLSDATGQYFVLSLENVYHVMKLNWLEIDFHEVQGMNWTFLVNKKLTKSNSTWQTYISYDKGGNWAPLMVNQSCKVVEQCALNLQVSQTSYLTTVYSQTNAIGIILAHGTLGTNLPNQRAYVFTSNDGGANWIQAVTDQKEQVNGTFRFNILDQGSILTAIPDGFLSETYSTTLYYSTDQGYTWKAGKFDDKGLLVKGVLTEPGIMTMVESVFGHESKGKPWTLIKMNFTGLLPRKCEDKDYTTWTPQDYNSKTVSNCSLGSVVIYKRRLENASCYNGKSFSPKTENKICPCTAEDYECDYGFEEIDGACKMASWYHDGYVQGDCNDGGKYNKSKGYRKIPADTCVAGSEDDKYSTQVTECPLTAPAQLTILSEMVILQTGKEITFYLEQAEGSKFNTTYSWNFGDSSPVENAKGLKEATPKKHTFQHPGHYNVTVTARNDKGSVTTSTYVHCQDAVRDTYIVAPWATKTGIEVNFTLIVFSNIKIMAANEEHLYYIWTFGDEKPGSLPLLTWNNSVTHIFERAGNYKVTIEALNSISSVYKEYEFQVFDNAEILELTLSENAAMYAVSEPIMREMFTQRLRQLIAEYVGVKMSRIEAVITKPLPVIVHLYIFPSSEPGELNISEIKQIVIDQTQKGALVIDFIRKPSDPYVIKITTATDISGDSPGPNTPSTSGGINMKPLFIAAPILVLAVIVSMVSFLYCRRKMHNVRQYNILNTQDDSDAMLDDDEAPLDLNVDFGIRESSRDDQILDSSGGSHLVMVTGGSSDHSVPC